MKTTKKEHSGIPTHRLSDRHTSGISLQCVSHSSMQKPHIMTAHRDDHYIFIFQQKGTSTFFIDFEEITIKGKAVFCILPGQVHYFKSSRNAAGWFLAIETLQVKKLHRDFFEEKLYRHGPVNVAANMAGHLERCIAALHQMMTDKDGTYAPDLLSGLASVFIGLIADSYKKNESTQKTTASRSSQVTQTFRNLLRQHFLEEKSPAGYAEQMNLSLSYLNECVKSETGMPVSHWIVQEVILEAKRLLYYSSLSVKEIAFKLGYEDHAYFSRVFSKAANMSPGDFRRSYRE